MPTAVQAALLGAVQGLTEFLPISSTAHLLIAARLLGYDDPDGVFTVMIQPGAILAIMWLYRQTIVDIVRGLGSKPEARRFALVIAAACVPSLAGGALLSGYIKTVLYQSMSVIAVTFVAGGIVMLIVERFRPVPAVMSALEAPLSRAVVIGLCQMLALVPGVSRSGATIVGGMLMGLDRRAAAEFSFFVAMPTMAAAFGHEFLEARHQLDSSRASEIAIGFVTAFIAALAVVKPFLWFVGRAGFKQFAWYRIGVGLLLFAAVLAGWSN
jgi:undecaprenyl-diphosphatase